MNKYRIYIEEINGRLIEVQHPRTEEEQTQDLRDQYDEFSRTCQILESKMFDYYHAIKLDVCKGNVLSPSTPHIAEMYQALHCIRNLSGTLFTEQFEAIMELYKDKEKENEA